MMQESIKTYIAELNKLYATGVAREHAYRVPLQNLMTALLPKGYTIVNEPARIACGAPDYIILHGDVPMAFIEAKDLDDRDLDGNREHREQFERYKNSLNSIVFTDYLDFHLYIGGEFQDAVRLAEIRGNKIVVNEANEEHFLLMVSRLVNSKPQKITSPVKLAKVMASKARMLAQVIEKALDNDPDGTTELAQQMKVFKDLLIHDLNNKTFADIYAQTIAYGLFSARLNDPTPEDFSRMEANTLIPKSNPFLRKIFNDIAGFNIDSRIEWIVDDLVEAFRVTDMDTVMKDFGEATKRNDPMMHFYEDFLGQYDPQTKAQRGVYYTPQPVVDFIVRAVDDILKRDFNLPMGLADNSMIDHEVVNDQYSGKKGESKTLKKRMHRVQILDPATGTGTFLATVIRQIHANMEGQWGAWGSYVEQHLLPRLNGFELMMASYTIAHLKLDLEIGITAQDRLRIFLTNSLEEANPDANTLFGHYLAEEANKAKKAFLYRNYRPGNTPEWRPGMPLRFKADPKDRNYHDEVFGDLHMSPETQDDIILIKADGLPTYNFAHIVDDATMGKLGKRDGAKSAVDYRADGILPEAMLNFLACLGWNDGTEDEIYSKQDLIEKFSLDRIQRAGARYDEQKLIWLNGQWIRRLFTEDPKALFARTKDFWPEIAAKVSEEEKYKVFCIIYDRLKTLSDLRTMTTYFFEDPNVDMDMLTTNKALKKLSEQELCDILKLAADELAKLNEWSAEMLQNKLNELLEKSEQKPAVFFGLVRLSVSFAPFSPALHDTLSVLGREKTLARLHAVITAFGRD